MYANNEFSLQGLPECNGISLDSLPPTPPLDALTVSESFTYTSGIG